MQQGLHGSNGEGCNLSLSLKLGQLGKSKLAYDNPHHVMQSSWL